MGKRAPSEGSMGFEIKIRGDKEVFDKLSRLKGLFQSDALKRILEDSKNRIVFIANRMAPKRSRALANSIAQSSRVENFGTKHVTIRVGTPFVYGIYQEKGTKPRTFGPEVRRVMFWTDYDSPQKRLFMSMPGGKRQKVGAVFHFADVVHHPGNPPHPFLRPAAELVKPRLMAAVKKLIVQAGGA
jgi:HK97 gp10 family phage protein